MNIAFRNYMTPLRIWSAVLVALVAFAGLFLANRAGAEGDTNAPGGRLVTIHDRGQEKVVLTYAETVRQALDEIGVTLDENDMVEPSLDEEFVATDYTVNIYRARPVIVVDGAVRQKVMTPYQTAAEIAGDAGVTLRGEDRVSLAAADNIIAEGASIEMTIDRATEFTLVLYGKETTAYTQATTVGAMLKAKNITLEADDTLSAPVETALVPGMTVEIWRDGTQTITEDKVIPFETEKIQDVDRDPSFREVKTPGVNGKRTVTYEIEMKNGKEVSRKEIQNVVVEEPKKQVEVVGAKLPTPTNPTEAQALGKQMMLAYGFGEDQWPCLYNLWMRESGWRTTAGNPSSGAYGIPQALPGNKMGPGWQTDARVQIQWGLGYIKGRYQTPCGAWSAFQTKGWY